MCTSAKPAQIDDSYFRCRRKYNRGRYLHGNNDNRSENGSSDVDSDTEGASSDLSGPCMLGICTNKTNVRFLIVPDRRSTTLIPIKQDKIALGSRIYSDEWGAYNSLKSLGYIQETVNHSENFIDPKTGAKTKRIEKYLKEGKIWLKKVSRPTHLMQSNLDEIAWLMCNSESPDDLLGAFLKVVKEHYTCSMQ